jgi:Zn-finger domain-containing protein
MINTREKTTWEAQRERLDTVDRDVERMLKCRNWRSLAEDRDAIEGAKAQFGL